MSDKGIILSLFYFIGLLMGGVSTAVHFHHAPFGFMIIGVGCILYSVCVSLWK